MTSVDPHRIDGLPVDGMIPPTSNEAFAEHLLSLFSLVVPAPGTTQHPAQYPSTEVDELLSRHHSRSQAELQVEKAVLEMGMRLRDAEWQLAMSGTQGGSANGESYLNLAAGVRPRLIMK